MLHFFPSTLEVVWSLLYFWGPQTFSNINLIYTPVFGILSYLCVRENLKCVDVPHKQTTAYTFFEPGLLSTSSLCEDCV